MYGAPCVLQGAFAEAQALFLHPVEAQVQQLASVLAAQKMGVVAHFYMDPEVPPLCQYLPAIDFDTDAISCQVLHRVPPLQCMSCDFAPFAPGPYICSKALRIGGLDMSR